MRIKFFSLSVMLLIGTSTFSQTTNYYSKDGIAIKGYDPVAFFILQKAAEGTDSYTTEWSGSKWKFISQANKDSFITNPLKYVPQYGGFCAFGASENHKAPTDPNAWTVINNKLYLNYSNKVKEMWIKDTANRIKAADEYWTGLNK